MDDQERLPPSPDLRVNGQNQRWEILYQVGHPMGLQQRLN